MFNRIAEIAKDYLKKGSKIYIEGRLQLESGKTKTAKTDTAQRSLLTSCKC